MARSWGRNLSDPQIQYCTTEDGVQIAFYTRGTNEDRMADPMNDYNRQIIEEFRANERKVGAPFEGATLRLLTHRGAKTGAERTNPLAYLEEDGRYFVFGSKGGASTNPDWYHNLGANPDATIEIGIDKLDVAAEVLTGEERDRVWARNVQSASVREVREADVAEDPGGRSYA